MKRAIRWIVPLALAAGLPACRDAAHPAAETAVNADAHCLQYAPGMATLSGMASTRTVTAPGKDSREALLLTLDTPICIATHPSRAAEYPSRDGVKLIELVPQSDFASAYSLAGGRVTAHGGLVPMSGDGAAAPVGLVLRTLKPAE